MGKLKKVEAMLLTKSSMKQDVFDTTKVVFNELKDVLRALCADLKRFTSENDGRIEVSFETKGPYECQLTLGGDTLIFQMHTNVFYFDEGHLVYKSPYVIKDKTRAYCGIINVYNFLADSFRYQRVNDFGYLIGRIFINRDRHFFVEGPRKVGYLFNDFSNAVIGKEVLTKVSETIFEHALEFDLYTPPFQTVREVTLDQMQSASHELMPKTGKRMGFRFTSEDKDMPR